MVYVTKGCKELKRNYPITSGTAATEKHEGRTENLVAVEGTLVLRRNRRGIK